MRRPWPFGQHLLKPPTTSASRCASSGCPTRRWPPASAPWPCSPHFPEALLNRANALLQLKRTTEALATYDKALAIPADYAEAHNFRGIALQIQRRRDEALASFDRAVALRPDFVEALDQSGLAAPDSPAHG